MTLDPEPPDDLEALLAPPSASAPAHVQDAIRVRTERVIGRRILVRRIVRLGVGIVVFLAGIGVGRKTHGEPPLAAIEPAPMVVPLLIPIPAAAADPNIPESVPAEPATAALAELLAEQADEKTGAARLYRLAGDKYLNDRQDYRNAARCYRIYLDRAGDAALQPHAADTWLLTSIKNAAFQEKSDGLQNHG